MIKDLLKRILPEFIIKNSTLKKYRGKGGDIVIPDKVKIIGAKAFANKSKVISVVLHRGVEEIQSSAFIDCVNLKSINLENVAKLSESAFYHCRCVEKIKLSKKLVSIEPFCFAHCIALSSLDIPNGVKQIDRAAFFHCESLKAVKFGANVESLANMCFSETAIESVELPENIVYVSPTAFYLSNKLSKIAISDNNYFYESYQNCLILKSNNSLVLGTKDCIIPSNGSVSEIGEKAFWRVALERVYLPFGVTKLGRFSFASTSVKSLSLPEGLIEIEAEAFLSTSIRSVNLPKTLTFLGDAAFSSCYELEKIVIPEGVKTLNETFEYCEKLSEADVSSVTEIGNYTFSNCLELKRLTLSSRLATVGNYAFENCGKLNLSFSNSLEYVGEGAFSAFSSGQTIKFACSESTSDGWNKRWKRNCNANIIWNVDYTNI